MTDVSAILRRVKRLRDQPRFRFDEDVVQAIRFASRVTKPEDLPSPEVVHQKIDKAAAEFVIWRNGDGPVPAGDWTGTPADGFVWLMGEQVADAYYEARDLDRQLSEYNASVETLHQRLAALNADYENPDRRLQRETRQRAATDALKAAEKGSGAGVSVRGGKSSSKKQKTEPKRLPRWKEATDPLKAIAMARAAEKRGGLSISVNLSQAAIDGANNAKKPFASHIQDRLRGLLSRAFDRAVDFFIVVEDGASDDPHIHGVVDLPDTLANRKRLREVLKRLGGEESGAGPIKDQVHMRRLHTPAHWGAYPFKNVQTTRNALSIRRTLAATLGMIAKGKAAYEAMREEYKNQAR